MSVNTADAPPMQPRWQQWLRWLAPVVLLALLLLVFRDELPFLGKAWKVLGRAQPWPVVAGVITASLAIAAMAGVMQILLNIEGRITDPARTNAITLASNAWSTTVPGGPAISAWLTYRVHRSWGASVGLCGWFFVISGALSTVWMVVIGVAAVVLMGADLSLTSLSVTLLLAVAAIGGLFWATRHPEVLKRWVGFVPQKVRERVERVIDQVAEIRMTGGQFVTAAVLSLLNQLFDVCTMVFAVWAVLGSAPGFTAGLNEITIMGVAIAFIMTKLAGAAQITPGGVGTVEPVLAGMLVAGGMTLIDATAATVLYRTISFALITAIGWVVYAWVYAGRGYMLGIRLADAERRNYAAGNEAATDN
ncbi:YbhN family protein [Corynebacterium sp. TA-R-1]|uniref:YbhN family protein n=1 Tax=Corynebacterium stercoris TaxID=2943490 RepID=A0ABT1G3H6_9CORY|nr:YbhN family protein [Corynebacterium stercoris]MCP1387558.1 YbhN family protein [Corynebacterium stercoris]